jgi:SPP1 gp7 family putative phage head morphogenesis protein
MGLVKQRWSVPIVGRQYVAPQTLNVVQAAIRDNVNLIKKISANDVNRISDVLIKGLSEGKNESDLRQELALTDGFDKKRIERVVIDQTNKLNNAVQTANANSLGITEAIWVHVAGQYTSRPSHVKMNGQKFDINKGLYDPEVGYNVKCGELPFCRCTMRLIFKPDQVDEA